MWQRLRQFCLRLYPLMNRYRPALQRQFRLYSIFLFWELRGLSPNFYIHVSVSDLYIPRIGPHISSSRNGSSIVGIYNSLTDTWMWKLGLRPRYSFSGNICFQFSAFFLCSVLALFSNYSKRTSKTKSIQRTSKWLRRSQLKNKSKANIVLYCLCHVSLQ